MIKLNVCKEKAASEKFHDDAKLRDLKISHKASRDKLSRYIQTLMEQDRDEFEDTICHIERVHARKCKNLVAVQEKRHNYDRRLYDLEIRHLNTEMQNLLKKRYNVKSAHQRLLDKKALEQLREVLTCEVGQIKELFSFKNQCTEEMFRLRSSQLGMQHVLEIRHFEERRAEKEALANLKSKIKVSVDEDLHNREMRKLNDRNRIQLYNLRASQNERLHEIFNQTNYHNTKVSVNLHTWVDTIDATDERTSITSIDSSERSAYGISTKTPTPSYDQSFTTNPSASSASVNFPSTTSSRSSYSSSLSRLSSREPEEQIQSAEEKIRLTKFRHRDAQASLASEHLDEIRVMHDFHMFKMTELKKSQEYALMLMQKQHETELMELKSVQEKEIVMEQSIHDAEIRVITERRVLGSVLNSVIDGIIIIDTSAKILRLNEAVTVIFGYSQEELIGQNVNRLMPLSTGKQHDGYITKYLETGVQNIIGRGRKLIGRKKDGSEFDIQLTVTEVKQEGVHLFTGVIRDISNETEHEKKMAQKIKDDHENQVKILAAEKKRTEEAEYSRNQQERYIDMICHEIRNPLNGIQNNNELLSSLITDLVSILQTDNLLDSRLSNLIDSSTEAVSSIALCAKHQKAIADDCLNMSKLNMNLIRISTTTPLDPVAITQSVFAGVVEEAKTNDIELILIVKKDFEELALPSNQYLGGDPARLTQAKKLSNSRISVEIDALSSNESTVLLEFSITDPGFGMSKSEQQLLDEPINQATYKTYADYGGSGLGLYISKELIALMGGTIQTSHSKELGSTVTFTITAQVLASRLKIKQKPEHHSMNQLYKSQDFEKSKKPVLIVDDSSINRKVLRAHLERNGHECIEAENGQEAVTFVTNDPDKFGLILMDLEMPVLDGRQASQKIREVENRLCGSSSDGTPNRRATLQFPISNYPKTPKRTPIIAVTGNTFHPEGESPENFGMQGVLLKPFTRQEVLAIVSKYVL
ncbi:hypothetical protein HDU79_007920 [Rhizoclosmatium sp. JEL0117]|nr:hypothetical protein HDU79_007920 [Rhizoclosmatium sp. JEL0117]